MKLDGLTGLEHLSELNDLLKTDAPQRSFNALLDTGASGYVISQSTAKRFAIEAVPEAIYHEVGLHGPTPMGVSRPYTLLLAESNDPRLEIASKFRIAERGATFQLNPKPANPLITLAMGEINVIGMPAIGKLVVEIDPSAMMAGGGELRNDTLEGKSALDLLAQVGSMVNGPTIRLHDRRYRPRQFDLVIPLSYFHYERRNNPLDRGPLPSLRANPTIRGIATSHAGRSFTGDWLLDTAAPTCIISTAHAQALGLYDEHGNATRPSDFSLPLGGIGGEVKPTSGFRIERLRIKARRGRIIEYHGVHAIVHDVTTELDSGETVTLDGVFGTNLLLPTIGGLTTGIPTDIGPMPFQRIWIDGPRGQLLLKR